jgi:hypothetical protein
MLCSLGVMTWISSQSAKFAIYFPWYTMIGCAVTILVALVAREFSGRMD